jgi:cyclase
MGKSVRIIARLDVKGPNLIKGVCLEGFRVLGTAAGFAHTYEAAGVDEVLLADTVASLYRREPGLEVVRRVADALTIPLTVAGGIRTVDDVRAVLASGADKVAINTAAVQQPELLRHAVDMFGAQCIVSSIEAFRHPDGRCEVWTDYGRQSTGIDVFRWVDQVVGLGVGEIVLTSINREGTGRGFDLVLTARIAERVPVPVVASGGAGRADHFVAAVKDGAADAVAAASVFHYRYLKPPGTTWMSYDGTDLRRGSEIDAGNVDFINHGYGGDRSLLVEPLGVDDVRAALSAAGILVRPSSEGRRP